MGQKKNVLENKIRRIVRVMQNMNQEPRRWQILLFLDVSMQHFHSNIHSGSKLHRAA
jgi:hypothetical protein